MTDYRVQAGQTATGVGLSDADTMEIYAGGAALGTFANLGGLQTVYGGGSAASGQFGYFGEQDVLAGGLSTDDTIYRIGLQKDYGTAVNTQVVATGSQLVYGSAIDASIGGDLMSNVILTSGYQQVFGTASGTTLVGGSQSVHGTATGTNVRYGVQTVVAGGTAIDTTIGHDDMPSLPAGFSSLQLQQGAMSGGTITFAGLASLEIDRPIVGQSRFDTPLVGFAPGDMIDLAGLPYAAATTATIANGTLIVDAGSISEAFALEGASATQVDVTADAQGRTLLTAVDRISIDPQVAYSAGRFIITGEAPDARSGSSVALSALVDGFRQNLGAATVAADGTFAFSDVVGAHVQGFVTATEIDTAGVAASAQAPYALTGGGPVGGAEQDTFNADGSAVLLSTRFGANGRRDVDIEAPGQTVDLQPFDIVSNHRRDGTSFVFDRGDGLDVISGFKVGDGGHDTLSLPGADFGNSVADVLRQTGEVQGSAFVTDPKTGDAVRLAGVTAAELKAHPKDFAFHT